MSLTKPELNRTDWTVSLGNSLRHKNAEDYSFEKYKLFLFNVSE